MFNVPFDPPFILFIGQRCSDSASELSRVRVHWEADTRKALELLPIYKFDAVVLEAQTFPQRISEIRVRSGAVLVILADTPDACLEAAQAGADDFVLKPCHAGELLVRIRSLLD